MYVIEQIMLSLAWKGLHIEGSKFLMYSKFTELFVLHLYVQIIVFAHVCWNLDSF
jgi:hypothetical protein